MIFLFRQKPFFAGQPLRSWRRGPRAQVPRDDPGMARRFGVRRAGGRQAARRRRNAADQRLA